LFAGSSRWQSHSICLSSRCAREVKRSFGFAFAIPAILVSFVSIFTLPLCAVNVSLTRSTSCSAFPPPTLHWFLRYYATIRLPVSLSGVLPFDRLFAILHDFS